MQKEHSQQRWGKRGWRVEEEEEEEEEEAEVREGERYQQQPNRLQGTSRQSLSTTHSTSRCMCGRCTRLKGGWPFAFQQTRPLPLP
jgi:hypothetical protein